MVCIAGLCVSVVGYGTASASALLYIGVDLAGIGGCMVSAESGSVPSGVRYGEGCPLPSRLGDLGERRELLQRGPGQSPGQKRILAYFEGHRTLLFVPI